MRERQILDILNGVSGQWINRTEISKNLGRRRLNQGDFEAIGALQARGLIEAEKRPDPTPIGYQMFYRAIVQQEGQI